ncbi:MAG: PstS family phosphate ABC transporter substrate-binding protein [Polyangiaceae bacterium]|jgi:phosphate transport system substrate-binding protein|nr:PstS family phosphate ABC transporter substrate-binding protein [Polyangiaceae bacterium]MBK8937755.1 PstS family phosphate ABC transporter substrate-binding protein [Polyangiaceae bacterium]
MARTLATLGLSAAFLVSCGSKDTTLIKADGSSTVYPITEAVAEQFKKSNPKVNITVGISGTGGGFKKFCAGEIDLADASRPIKPTEEEACKKSGVEYIEVPVAYDGIAIVVHPSNDWAKSITTEELKKLWEPEAQGKIKKWSDVRAGWPDKEIHLFGAGVDSGTYDYFSEAITKKEKSTRGDYTSSEDDNVLVQGIANDPLALGFFGIAYFEENKERLKVVPVDDGKSDNGDGPITPTATTVRDGTYQPLSRPIFIYLSKKSLERPEVMALGKFYLAEAPKLVPEVGYVPLQPKAYELATARVEKKLTGSLFAGKGGQVGVSIEDVLEKGAQ